MRFWHALTMEPMDERLALCQAAESLGYTGVTFGDHLMTPQVVGSRYPYVEDGRLQWDPSALFPDPFQVIAALSVVTTTLRFMTAIYILPLRDVFSAAKSVATAAVLSGNRLDLGVGIGWMREEFDLTGHDFATRGHRTDEMLEIIPALLRGGMVEYHGQYHDFTPVQMSPVPSRPVPIIVGGESDRALRRAARAGGWITSPREIEAVEQIVPRFRRACAEVGSEDGSSRIVALMKGVVDADACRRLDDVGVTDVVMPGWLLGDPADSTLGQRIEALTRRADKTIHAMP